MQRRSDVMIDSYSTGKVALHICDISREDPVSCGTELLISYSSILFVLKHICICICICISTLIDATWGRCHHQFIFVSPQGQTVISIKIFSSNSCSKTFCICICISINLYLCHHHFIFVSAPQGQTAISIKIFSSNFVTIDVTLRNLKSCHTHVC